MNLSGLRVSHFSSPTEQELLKVWSSTQARVFKDTARKCKRSSSFGVHLRDLITLTFSVLFGLYSAILFESYRMYNELYV